jgi:hypothetical protein
MPAGQAIYFTKTDGEPLKSFDDSIIGSEMSPLARQIAVKYVIAEAKLFAEYQRSMPEDEFKKTVISSRNYVRLASEFGGREKIVISLRRGSTEVVVGSLSAKRMVRPKPEQRAEDWNGMPHLTLMEFENASTAVLRSFFEHFHKLAYQVYEMGDYYIDKDLPPELYRKVRKALWSYFYDRYFRYNSNFPYSIFVFDVYGEDRKKSTETLAGAHVMFSPDWGIARPIEPPHYLLYSFGTMFQMKLKEMLSKP